MKKNLQRLIPLLGLSLCLSGCGAPSSRIGTENIAGVYQLESVDGANVPATVRHDGAKLEIRSGTFLINPDGTCRSTMIFVPPSGKEVTREVKATYKQSGSKLTMKWEGAGVTAGEVTQDTFTMHNEGMILSYRK